MTLENETGDGPLTFILILKSCGMGERNPGTSSMKRFQCYSAQESFMVVVVVVVVVGTLQL